ncbi:MAG: CRISPR-associated helicase Cas3' [Arcobacteraceae bacterium]|jgi:CRISPR-associated endonuclease/helicase Cas3|nr:CRISPR-associated helicase Cas3' [Arcobacteraceae bacterium]
MDMMEKTTPLSRLDIDERYLAHTPDESLIDHSNLTIKYFEKIVKNKNLTTIIKDMIKRVDDKNSDLLEQMFIDAIYLHDIGKINPHFQAKKMNNTLFKEYKEDSSSSDHSFLSSSLYIKYYKAKIDSLENIATREKFRYLLYAFSYHLAKHHGRLSSFEEYRKDEKEVIKYWQYLDRFKIAHFEFYILNKLLFSLLISSDYYATTDYMAKIKIDEFGLLDNRQKELMRYRFDSVISKFTITSGINRLRNEIFKEAESTLLQNLDKNIFYLEAPTGSGKTISSINLSLKLLSSNENLNKLFYIFPFNTLVEQTKSVFDNIFGDELQTEIINSITPINLNNQEDEETKYERSYINRLFFHSSAIFTTHVGFFSILFGTSKEDNFPLWQLANSVIILDEIQSYNNNLWWYMVEFFDKYAILLNIKIIIMSATLPKIDYFLKEQNSFVSLIDEQKRDYFFNDPLFAKRVELNFDLLDQDISLEILVNILEKQPKNKKILFEFIKKQSAREFYELIKDKFKNVYELSGDDNKAYRQYVINKSKEESLIIVATQVIEAGVDIDMDIGFKDISTLDSEEQFMGRINRSCLREGKVYFFDLDDANLIYRGDHRLGFDLKNQKYKDILESKDFASYYKDVLVSIKKQGDRFENGLLTNYDNFEQMIKKLDFHEISKTMKLINSQNYILYFPFLIDIKKFKNVKEFEDKEFIEQFLSDSKLDGQKVWDSFIELNSIEGYAKKKYFRSKINSLMQFFTFSIYKYHKDHRPHIGEDIYGYYFVDNLEFITDEGKFDRKKFNESKNSIFL